MNGVIKTDVRVGELKPRIVDILPDGTQIVVYEPNAPAEVYTITICEE